MPFSFTLTDIIPATPQQIYEAWLDSRGHTKMTGSAARAKPVQGATFSAWGGYIKGKNLTLRELAAKLKVNFTYLSKIENQKLSFGEYLGEDLIRKLAKVLGAEEDELLLLAQKIPEDIKKRVIERPDAFRKFAALDDDAIDKLLEELGEDE